LTDQILNAIDEELARLRQARAILQESGTVPAGKTATTHASSVTPKKKPRRKLSTKARHAIAEAQRKRWAKVKSQKKTVAPVPASKKEPAAS
jgi:hypothetical protein